LRFPAKAEKLWVFSRISFQNQSNRFDFERTSDEVNELSCIHGSERYEIREDDNPSVICFANATSLYTREAF